MPVELGHPLQEETAIDATKDDNDRLLAARQRLAEVFTPTRPLSGDRFQLKRSLNTGAFVGREVERKRILRALIEDRSHVAIYGERGHGKTSLANIVLAQASDFGFIVVYHVCSAASVFSGIMRSLFHELPRWANDVVQEVSDGRHGAASLLPASGPLQPSDILTACELLPRSRVIFVIDEFDRIAEQDTRTAIADTIKQCSDRGASLFFMLIGVSDSFEELLGRHPSIQRCVAHIGLPLLAHAEVEQLVARGAQQAGLEFPTTVRACIAELALGMPYMASSFSLVPGDRSR